MKPKEQQLIKVKAPFIDEISGLVIVKILDGGTHSTLLIKLKCTCNAVILDTVNNGTETMIFRPEEKLAIVDLKYMTDWEILNKCIDLENSCLTREENKEVMEMLYK